MKTNNKFVVAMLNITLAFMITIVGLGAVCYTCSVQLPWQKSFNGVNGFIDLVSQKKLLEKDLIKDVVVVTPRGERTLETEKYVDALIDINSQSVRDWLFGEPISYSIKYKWKELSLKQDLNDYWVSEPWSAVFEVDKGSLFPKVILAKEHLTVNCSVTELYNAIVESVANRSFRTDVTDMCTPPPITANMLESKYNSIKWINDVLISYKDCDACIDAEWLYNHLEPDGTVDYENLDLSEIMNKLEEVYNSPALELEFRDNSGKTRTVKYNTYGRFVNREKEEEAIIQMIKNRHNEMFREPIMIGYDDFGDTYMEVSIDAQHVWHYSNGKVCCESDCVTGRKGVHDTPTGVFYVSEKMPGKYLVGDGNSYKTWVNRWMRLTNRGVGFHDAYWRGSFGKSIYTYNGSHGCINLPSSYAYSLYEEIERGIPVVIY